MLHALHTANSDQLTKAGAALTRETTISEDDSMSHNSSASTSGSSPAMALPAPPTMDSPAPGPSLRQMLRTASVATVSGASDTSVGRGEGSLDPINESSSAEDAASQRSGKCLSREFLRRMKPTLDAIETVRSVLTVEDVELPGIVVLGNQSSGKSSVLEAVSGINFPRGENICTRVPCILRLQADPDAVEGAFVSTDAQFEGARRVRLAEIGGEIQKLTDDRASIRRMRERGTGGGGGFASSATLQQHEMSIVTDEPIHVKVVRKHGPTLTLIDLPGITHMHPSQHDIHDIIVGMIRKYIQNPAMLMLVCVSAENDFQNAEALKLAREVDPEGNRTIGVVTKTDLVGNDSGSDIVKKLKAERAIDVRLKRGWIAVRCRTPREVRSNLDSGEVARLEREFFSNHALFRSLDARYKSIPTLVNRVVDLQSQTIVKWLPKVKQRIRRLIFERETKLRDFPELCESDTKKRVFYNRLITRLQGFFDDCAQGNYTAELEHFGAPSNLERALSSGLEGAEQFKLSGTLRDAGARRQAGGADGLLGAGVEQYELDSDSADDASDAAGPDQRKNEMHIPPRLHERFVEFKAQMEKRLPNFLSAQFGEKVTHQYNEHTGTGLPCFFFDPVFKRLFRDAMGRVERPKARLIEEVREYMLGVLDKLIVNVAGQEFPLLAQHLMADTRKYLHAQHEKALLFCDQSIEAQKVNVFALDEKVYNELTEAIQNVVKNYDQLRRTGEINDKEGDPIAVSAELVESLKVLDLFGIDWEQLADLVQIRRENPRQFLMQVALCAYTTSVSRLLLDVLPKALRLFFISHLRVGLFEELGAKPQEFLDDYLVYDPEVEHERLRIADSLRRLQGCLARIESF